jgi:hypothetical protein
MLVRTPDARQTEIFQMRDDGQTGYLFQCGDEELFAISPDKTGRNIPRTSCTQGWLLREQFPLDAQVPALKMIGNKPILRSITDKGYYIWRASFLPA